MSVQPRLREAGRIGATVDGWRIVGRKPDEGEFELPFAAGALIEGLRIEACGNGCHDWF